MKLLPKFALLSIGVAAVPLAIAGYSSIRVSQAALREAIEGHEVLLARQISEYVSSHLSNLQATMSVETRILDLTRVGGALPTAEALRKFLQLVYHQSDDFSVGGGIVLGFALVVRHRDDFAAYHHHGAHWHLAR